MLPTRSPTLSSLVRSPLCFHICLLLSVSHTESCSSSLIVILAARYRSALPEPTSRHSCRAEPSQTCTLSHLCASPWCVLAPRRIYPQVSCKGMEQHMMSGSKRKETNDSKMKDIRLRHALETTPIVEINSHLTDAQKSRLETTPFKWVVEMKSSIKVPDPLLRELVRRWDKHNEGFRIRGRVVSFTTLDACFAIGLPIVGELVSLDDSGDCCVKELFKGKKDITVQNIVEKCKELSGEDEVEDFCRVYILLAFSVLYFPRTTLFVFSAPFRLLDDLDALWEYNWGVAVYDFLVDSLSCAASNYSKAKNSAQLLIAGCAAILQIWAVEHLSLRPTSTRTCFPRINMWTQIEGGSRKLEEAFKHNMVLAGTEEDRQHLILFKTINEAEGGFRQWQRLLQYSG